MENKNRNIFGLHGITGMLIITVILISILAFLTILAIKTQNSVANKPYSLQDITNVEQKSSVEIQNKTIVIKE